MLKKAISNQERIDRMLCNLQKDRDYKILLYDLRWWFVIEIFTVFIMCCLLSITDVINVKKWIGCISIALLFLILCTYIMYRKYKETQIADYMVSIEANINVGEIEISSPYFNMLRIGFYHLVAYYVKDDCTYRFVYDVKDNSLELYNIFERIVDKCEFPKIKIFINPHDYTDYRVLGCDFLADTIRLNLDLVDKELDDLYRKTWDYYIDD